MVTLMKHTIFSQVKVDTLYNIYTFSMYMEKDQAFIHL